MNDEAVRLGKDRSKVGQIYYYGGIVEKIKQEREIGHSLEHLITEDFDRYMKLMHERVKSGFYFALDYVYFDEIPEEVSKETLGFIPHPSDYKVLPGQRDPNYAWRGNILPISLKERRDLVNSERKRNSNTKRKEEKYQKRRFNINTKERET